MSVVDFVRTLAPAPDWLKEIQNDAREKGLDRLTMDDINAEIDAARRERRERRRHPGASSHPFISIDAAVFDDDPHRT